MRDIYNVTIRATITKTLTVVAENEEEAREVAHAEFTTACDGDEDYSEDCLHCDKIGETE